MHVKLITEHDCAKECIISTDPIEMILIYRAMQLLSENKGLAESYRERAHQMCADLYNNFEQVEMADEMQTDCSWK